MREFACRPRSFLNLAGAGRSAAGVRRTELQFECSAGGRIYLLRLRALFDDVPYRPFIAVFLGGIKHRVEDLDHRQTLFLQFVCVRLRPVFQRLRPFEPYLGVELLDFGEAALEFCDVLVIPFLVIGPGPQLVVARNLQQNRLYLGGQAVPGVLVDRQAMPGD